MAEAHSAVAFSFAITHEGWDVNFDREVLHLVWQSGIRSWKKRLNRFRNSVHNGVYPGHTQSLWVLMAVITAVHFSGYKVPYDAVNAVLRLLPDSSSSWQLVGCALVALGIWLSVIFFLRYTLKLLLIYKGWMYESRAKGSTISFPTKLWLVGIKVLSGWKKPKLYSFQGSLPRLPLPSVKDTMRRYLRSARPLLNDENYARMQKLAEDFENGIAVKLQRYLWLKSWWSSNYVSDWWEEYVYLRGRGALMVNSNFYGIDAILMHNTTSQAARAAQLIYQCLKYRRMVERQELEPILVQGLVPLCSWQYERTFNTVRAPGEETDRIVHYPDSNHITVYHKGRYFKVVIYHRGRLLKPCELQIQIEQILADTSAPQVGEETVAALTAGNRTHWAQTRTKFFFKGPNRACLDVIERSAMVLALDNEPFEYDPEHPEKLDHYGRILLHGNGHNRWFDKSFTLCVGTNGRVGFNAEHTWADAAVMSHLWEIVMVDEATNLGADAPVMAHMWEHIIWNEAAAGYDEFGNTLGKPEFTPPAPVRLQWQLDNKECLEAIDKSYNAAQVLLNEIDLRIYVHDAYGKGFMKNCGISPDAYLQMALQLAYYRDAGRFSLTYEASMTRMFREGRTETVRPCTIESAAWVKSMMNKDTSVKERVDLLYKACQQHQLGYQDAMCGKGIDRHLFCLYVVSKYLEVDSPFLNEVLSEPWRLSTSQTPHAQFPSKTPKMSLFIKNYQRPPFVLESLIEKSTAGQTSLIDLKKYPNCISAGGGFGPVADDGYGVSYIIAGEDLLFFHISSKKPCPNTNSNKFALEIERALADIKNLFEENKRLQISNNTK